jgi:hypothetical protein
MSTGGSPFGEGAVASGNIIEGLIKGGGMAAGGGAFVVPVPGTATGAMLSVAAAVPATFGSAASVPASSVALAPATLWLSAVAEAVGDSAVACAWLRSCCGASDDAPGTAICIGTPLTDWDTGGWTTGSTAGGVVTGRGEIKGAAAVER